MIGKENNRNSMAGIREFFKKDRFAEYVGLELVAASPGTATVRLEIRQEHLNGMDLVHGGAIFALADFAFAVASNSHGTAALGINATISYLKATRGGVLTADAVEVAKNHKTATYQINITNEKEDLIAVFQRTFRTLLKGCLSNYYFTDFQNEYFTSYGTVNTSGVTPIACKYSR